VKIHGNITHNFVIFREHLFGASMTVSHITNLQCIFQHVTSCTCTSSFMDDVGRTIETKIHYYSIPGSGTKCILW